MQLLACSGQKGPPRRIAAIYLAQQDGSIDGNDVGGRNSSGGLHTSGTMYYYEEQQT